MCSSDGYRDEEFRGRKVKRGERAGGCKSRANSSMVTDISAKVKVTGVDGWK
jgi:hypothetical protein